MLMVIASRGPAKRVTIWGSWLLIGWILCGVGYTYHPLFAQTDVERRVKELEEVHSDRRLSVVETRLDSIEFLGKAILTGVIGQLVLQGLNFRIRRSGNGPHDPASRIVKVDGL